MKALWFFLSCLAVLIVVGLWSRASGSVAVSSGTLHGQVVGVPDGDGLTLLLPSREQVRVRLVGIDAPEIGQPYGHQAKHDLSALVFKRSVRVDVFGQDKHGRTLGRVFVDSIDVNATMVSGGAAWVYRQYTRDRALIALERAARAEKRGLWALPKEQISPPWVWRRTR